MADLLTLEAALADLESRIQFDDHDVTKLLRDIPDPSSAAKLEFLAFSFSEHGESPWETHFGPLFAGKRDDGGPFTFPALESVTEEALLYWADRALAAKHPVLRARYAGLVWEFSRVVKGVKRSPERAHERIDAVLQIASGHLCRHDVHVWTLLEHALRIASGIRDTARRAAVVQAALDFEAQAADDRMVGLWAPAFDMLYGTGGKTGCSEEQEAELVRRLEDRLARLTDPAKPGDPWAADAVAERLARHYRRKAQPEEVARVLLASGALREEAAKQADALVAQGWLEDLHDRYRAFGLEKEAARLRTRIRELGPAVVDGMKATTHTFNVTAEQMKSFVDAVLEGEPERARLRFVVRYIPSIQDIKQQLAELSSRAPFSFLINRKLMDEHGRPVADIGSLEADPEGHTVLQMAQNMALASIFMREVLAAMCDRGILNEAIATELVERSPLYDPPQRLLVNRGFQAYLSNDPVVAIHILVPQIEAGVRTLAGLVGAQLLKPNKNGGMDHRLLDELLRDPIVVTTLGDDACTYLRVLYTDRRGVNLRNSVCHGLAPALSFNMGWADRVVHTLLLLLGMELTEE